MPKLGKGRQDGDKVTFGVLDVLRIVGGLLCFNALFSYWFTSTTTWGYRGKWTNARYLTFRVAGSYVHLSGDELRRYDGTDPRLPIYIGIYGKVYDVTDGREVYGPGGSYSFFSGRDSARAFVTGCFSKPDEFTYDLRGLDEDEALHDIGQWQKFYEDNPRYWYVGTVETPVVGGDPPSPCEHVKFPGYYVNGRRE